MEGKTITIKQIKSSIGATERQKRTIRALGLHRTLHEVTLPANPAVLGMIKKVERWLEVK
ncbi:50S ribosomal protein L30 [bacterium CG2_30_54_10]|nr:MAG: 50S ribosomal protein L30 [bacterium CG2_30_54_10]